MGVNSRTLSSKRAQLRQGRAAHVAQPADDGGRHAPMTVRSRARRTTSRPLTGARLTTSGVFYKTNATIAVPDGRPIQGFSAMTDAHPRFLHAGHPCRRAARSHHRRARDADLSDDVVRVRRCRPRGVAVRPADASATSIRASAIRPTRCWRSASPRSKAAPPGLRGRLRPRRAGAASCTALMMPGDEFVASKKLYGGSINQFNHAFKNFGWNVVWADPDDIGTFERAITPKTKAIFIESIANPGGVITDSRRSPQSRSARACRSSSTTRWRRPISASPSSTAPTSSCIR